MILHHGTSATLEASIKREGLRTLYGRVYLTSTVWVAREYAAINANGAALLGLDPRGLIVKVEVGESTLERDRPGFGACYFTREPIGPESIVSVEPLELRVVEGGAPTNPRSRATRGCERCVTRSTGRLSQVFLARLPTSGRRSRERELRAPRAVDRRRARR